MNITLEMVDEIIERTGVSYQEAKEALLYSEGDVLEAIIYIESMDEADQKGSFVNDLGSDLIDKLKELVKKGNVARIVIEKDEKLTMDIPVNAGILGAVFFTPAVVVALVTAMATGYAVKIYKTDGDIIDIKDLADETYHNIKDKAVDVKDKAKNVKVKFKKDDEEIEIEVEVADEEDNIEE